MSILLLLPHALLCLIVSRVGSVTNINAVANACKELSLLRIDPEMAAMFLLYTYSLTTSKTTNRMWYRFARRLPRLFIKCTGGYKAVVLHCLKQQHCLCSAALLQCLLVWITSTADVTAIDALLVLPIPILQTHSNMVLRIALLHSMGPIAAGLEELMLRGLHPVFGDETENLIFIHSSSAIGLLPAMILFFQYCPIHKRSHMADIALGHAVSRGNTPAVIFLLGCQFITLHTIKNTLTAAVSQGQSTILQILLVFPGVDATPFTLNSMLIRAINNNDKACVVILLNNGANVNDGLQDDSTILWHAVRIPPPYFTILHPYNDAARIEMVELLLAKGAVVTIHTLNAAIDPHLINVLKRHLP